MDRMQELVEILNEAGRVYYQESREVMPNFEYDKLYDELLALEKETGIILSNSPTINVGSELLSSLPKEAHKERMLSLNKTKDVSDLKSWLGDQKAVISWKLDGLTIVLTYSGGKLVKGVTRGNGEIGEVITSNARMFVNIPLTIGYKGELVLRGEAVIKYSDFNEINAAIEDVSSKYKNPRNLCSGAVRQLNTAITKERKVNFYAFALVSAGPESEGVESGPNFENSRAAQLQWLKNSGFSVVDFKLTSAENLESDISWFAREAGKTNLPSDGLVLMYDDIEYGRSLGATSKFPRDGIAFKWRDELAETTLKEVEWSASRTGLINPIAVFDPVELEGTTVSRASAHNVSIVKQLALGIGDRITVYKANMIIPQISENMTKSGLLEIPEHCPVCGAQTIIKRDNGVESLFCPNLQCPAKQIKSFTLLTSRDALNIEGLSEATIEKFIAAGIVKEPADLFKLPYHKDTIVNMEGFGEKSYEKLRAALKKASETNAARLLFGLGVPNIGLANAKLIAKYAGGKFERIMQLKEEELMTIPGVGEIMAKAFVDYFSDSEKKRKVLDLFEMLQLEEPARISEAEKITGKTFVITGSLEHFENRSQLKEFIESRGGKVAGSVSSRTDYLINNDNTSNSSKNKDAKELGIQIITEKEFLDLTEMETL